MFRFACAWRGVTASGTPAWTGEGAPKPATALSARCRRARSHQARRYRRRHRGVRAAVDPKSADSVVTQDLIAAINSMVDSAFVSTAAATAARPAGILNSITPVTSTGSTPAALAADLAAVAAAMIAAGSQMLTPGAADPSATKPLPRTASWCGRAGAAAYDRQRRSVRHAGNPAGRG